MDPADSLKPIASMWQWQRRGLCRTRNPDLFFHPDHERGAERQRRDERAQQVCYACPVRQECLAHAISCREPYGVWGGTTETERRTPGDPPTDVRITRIITQSTGEGPGHAN